MAAEFGGYKGLFDALDTSLLPEYNKPKNLAYLDNADKVIKISTYDQEAGISYSVDCQLAILKPAKTSLPPRQAIQIIKNVRDVSQVDSVLSQFSLEALLAVDIETNGLQAADSNIDLVGLGVAGSSSIAYFDFVSNSPEVNDRVLQFLKEFKGGLVGHNVVFDGTFLLREIGEWINWEYDTLGLYRQLANEGYQGHRYGLKEAQLQLLGWDTKGDVELDKWLVGNGHVSNIKKTKHKGYYKMAEEKWGKPKKAMMYLAPADILGYYCGLDAAATYMLLTEVMLPSIEGEPWRDTFLNYHKTFIRNVELHANQQLTGITVDREKMLLHQKTLEQKIKDTTLMFLNSEQVRPFATQLNQQAIEEHLAKEPEQFKKAPKLGKEPAKFTKAGKLSKNWEKWQSRKKQIEETGPEVSKNWINWQTKYHLLQQTEQFNLNSSQQLAELFYSHLSLPVLVWTPSGEPSTGKDALPGFGELGVMLKKIKVLEKELGYVTGCLNYMIQDSEGEWRIHPQFRMPGTLTCRLAGSGGLNCFHPDTEYLTKQRGWVKVAELKEGEEVWQVNPETKIGSWTKPIAIIEKEFTGLLKCFGGKRGELKVTPEHRMAWYKGKNQGHKYWETISANEEFSQTRRQILHCSYPTSPDPLALLPEEWTELQIAIMLQADGSIRKDRPDCYTLGFTNLRKIKLAEEILGKKGIDYGSQVKWNYIKFKSKYICNKTKRLNLKDLPIDKATAIYVFRNIASWDSYIRKVKGVNVEYSCTDEYNCDEIMAYLSRCGLNVSKRKYKNCYRLYITDNLYSDCRKDKHIREEEYKGKVYCVTVPEGHLMVRSGGRCWVTGNCQQLPKSRGYLECWRPKPGKVWIDLDFTALEQVVMAELTRDDSLFKLYGPGVNIDKLTQKLNNLNIKYTIIDNEIEINDEDLLNLWPDVKS